MTNGENLAAFLESKGIYDDFCTALLCRRGCSFERRIQEGCVFMDIINTSITWRNTQQGQKFWSAVSKEWNSKFLSNDFDFTSEAGSSCRSIW